MDSFLKQYCSKEWQQFINFHKVIFEFETSSYIFKEGEPVKGLFIVNSGKVKVFSTAEDKKETLIRLAADGAVIGHRGFGGDWTYPVSAFTYTKTKVTFIPLDIFNILAKANTEFTYHLMMFFAEELRQSEEKINLIPVKNKIATAILMNFNVFGADAKDPLKLSFTISRKDYASLVNTTYETVIRVLSDFNKENIIELQAKSIRIVDFNRLQHLANH